jgi:hypothetical protein
MEGEDKPSEESSEPKDTIENVVMVEPIETGVVETVETSAAEEVSLEPPMTAEIVYDVSGSVSVSTTFVDDVTSQEVTQEETVVTTTDDNSAEGCSSLKRPLDDSTIDTGAVAGVTESGAGVEVDVDEPIGAKKPKLDPGSSSEN